MGLDGENGARFASRFGSAMIAQSRTCGYFFEIAAAKLAKSVGSVGTQRGLSPPFAHRGVALSVIETCIPRATASSIAGPSSGGQRYAGSEGSVGFAGRLRATVSQRIPVCQTPTPRSR